MEEFNISRLNTRLGIVKLTGTTSLDEQTNQQHITVHQLEIMGCDGWVELDVSHDQSKKMLKRLHSEIIAHLGL